jgi:hypothetical protein
MRRLTVKIALTLSIITIFSGCCKESVSIPQKCKVPLTEEPTLDLRVCEDDNNSCVIEKVLKNYEAQKDYAKRLKVNSEVCK